jgi:hypothetical protein
MLVGIVVMLVEQSESRSLESTSQTLGVGGAGPSDVSLKIRASEDGTSELNFLVYGEGGSEYSISNDAKGTFRIESGEKLCLEIKTQQENEAKEASFLQTSSALRRRLLSSAPKVELAESITAAGRLNITTGYIATTSSGNFKVGGQRQWKMILHEDFQPGTVGDWTNQGDQFPLPPNNGISTCTSVTHNNADHFLGSYSNMEAVKTFLLPSHSRLRIKGRVHFIDEWKGEMVYLKMNGDIVWTKNHKWCKKILTTLCEDKGVSVCGNPSFPDTLSVPIDVVVSHSGTKLELAIGSNVKSGDGATWGFDDLQIFIM